MANLYQRAVSSTRFQKLDLIKRSQLEVRVRKDLKYESNNTNDVLPRRKEDLLNFIHYVVQIFKSYIKLHQEYNYMEEQYYNFTNKISQKNFNRMILDPNLPKKISRKMIKEDKIVGKMSKAFKPENYYKIPLTFTKKKYLQTLQEALKNRLLLADTVKTRVTNDFSDNEMIVTRKNQNLFMRILSGTLYKNNVDTKKNVKRKRNESKDLRIFDDENELEDIENWDLQKMGTKIKEKVSNQRLYRKIEDFQETFYHTIFQDLKKKAIAGNNWSGSNVLILPKGKNVLEKIFRSLNKKFNFENFEINKTKVNILLFFWKIS